MTERSVETPQLADGLIWRLVDGNVVVVSPEDGDVLVFSDTGSQIWQLIADKWELSDIETYLGNHYIVSGEQAHTDVISFVDELKELGLIV